MATKRMLQISEQIREHVATMLVSGKISDPRVRHVTLHYVKMSPDLQIAKIYFSVLGDEMQRSQATKGLKNAAGYIRRYLGRLLQIRYIPEIIFYYDTSIDYAIKMNNLITQVTTPLKQE
jgi:ribosome-binding factor A